MEPNILWVRFDCEKEIQPEVAAARLKNQEASMKLQGLCVFSGWSAFQHNEGTRHIATRCAAETQRHDKGVTPHMVKEECNLA
jgi:hypothetical protein